jgi:hypothetical protein
MTMRTISNIDQRFNRKSKVKSKDKLLLDDTNWEKCKTGYWKRM